MIKFHDKKCFTYEYCYIFRKGRIFKAPVICYVSNIYCTGYMIMQMPFNSKSKRLNGAISSSLILKLIAGNL